MFASYRSVKVVFIGLCCCWSCEGWSGLLAEERSWRDGSGQFEVSGELITFDKSLVVVRQSDGELVVLRRDQLSSEDQEFLATKSASPATNLNAQATDVAQNTELPPKPAPADKQLAANISAWPLINGKTISGKLIGFGTQTLSVMRREGQLWINQINLQKLPQAYQWIVVPVVAEVDKKPLKNLEELEEHLAAGGAGPFNYVVQGVQVELEEGGQITIPPALLESDVAKVVADGFARWQAAQVEGVSEEDRYATDDRERLWLDSYQRVRQMSPAVAYKLKLMELGLLSVNAGVTEIWEVELFPPHPFGWPRTVLVPGRDSLSAQRMAAQSYPGWRPGGVRKLSD